MPVRHFLVVLTLALALPASAQKFTHIAKAHYIKFTNKELYLLGYDLNHRRMCFNVSGGFGAGKDSRFLSPDDLDNGNERQKVRGSQTVFPVRRPPDSYLESCVSDYKIQQLRVGFTVFVRKNDTLGRRPSTGLHFGVEAMYSRVSESQTVVYKANLSEERFSYSGNNKFNTAGAASHIGWQFAFFKDHLYIDLRAVIPFYYPFTEEPNLNSPFAGNKYELQASIGWCFYRDKKVQQPEGDGGKVRDKI